MLHDLGGKDAAQRCIRDGFKVGKGILPYHIQLFLLAVQDHIEVEIHTVCFDPSLTRQLEEFPPATADIQHWFHVFKKLDVYSLAFFDAFLAASKPLLKAKIIERWSGRASKN
jgi:hypothetical protein